MRREAAHDIKRRTKLSDAYDADMARENEIIAAIEASNEAATELARWAQAWGPLTVEVAKWYAVANAFPNYRQAVMQYLYLLMRFGSYPATIRPPAIDPELGDGKLLSLIAYSEWEAAGRPDLLPAIYAAQQGLKSEVMAAHLRSSNANPVMYAYVAEMDRYSAMPVPAPRVMTLEEICIH